MALQVIKEKTITAPKVLIYGNAGVGKSTLASQFPKPIFLDLEGGLNYMDVVRTPLIKDADTFYKTLLELAKEKTEYQTIVIDSLDWLVRIMSEKVAGVGYDKDGNRLTGLVQLEATLNKNLMDANGGFGKAKEELENHIRTKLINRYLMGLNQMGYGIVLIAHSYEKEVLDDDGATVEKIVPKIDPATIGKKPVAQPAFVEWVDNIFYLKKVNGEHILQVESDNYAVAKNRLGLAQPEYNLKEHKITEILGLNKEK